MAETDAPVAATMALIATEVRKALRQGYCDAAVASVAQRYRLSGRELAAYAAEIGIGAAGHLAARFIVSVGREFAALEA